MGSSDRFYWSEEQALRKNYYSGHSTSIYQNRRIGYKLSHYYYYFFSFNFSYGLGNWTWRKIIQRRKKLRKEITEAEKALYSAFKALKEETEEQIAKLDGKPDLSNREKKICDELKKTLKISEKFIDKEIKDIEKEIH